MITQPYHGKYWNSAPILTSAVRTQRQFWFKKKKNFALYYIWGLGKFYVKFEGF